MSGRKNIVILTGIVLAVSLLVGSVTTMILSNHYNHAHMQVLGGICRKIIQKQPEAEQAVLEALKECKYGASSLPEENIILAYGYSPSDFWKSAEKKQYIYLGFCFTGWGAVISYCMFAVAAKG